MHTGVAPVCAARFPRPGRSNGSPLRLGDVPDVVEAVAGDIAGFGVLGPGVQRLAFVSPLLTAVVARDDRPIAGSRTAGGTEWRPVLGAGAVAGGLAAGVLVEGVEGHSRGIH